LLLLLAAGLLVTVGAVAEKRAEQPPIEVYFSPKGGCQDAIIKELDAAKLSVHVQAYSFTSAPIAKALLDAHKRGVKVEVVIDESRVTEQYSEATFFVNQGVPVLADGKHAIAHNKVMIIDGKTLITGSFNFTKAAEASNAESRVLDIVSETAPIVTWTPEAVYRYLVSLPGPAADPSMLQECMLGELFGAGISVIDQSHYVTYFGPAINQAKLSYQEQKESYLASTEHGLNPAELDRDFERVPDLEKPFFVSQMMWRIVRGAKREAKESKEQLAEANRRVRVAEGKAKDAEKAKGDALKAKRHAEDEARRAKNALDPKHIKKRKRQAKNRRRKRK
jgi:hypothetical protein